MNQMMHSGTACLAMLALASTVAYAADVEPIQTKVSLDSIVEETDGESNVPAELSVAPLDHVEYPPDRPSWLDNAPELVHNPHTWVVVATGETIDECEDEMQLFQRAAVASYIKQLANSGSFDFYPINNAWIEERLISRSYAGTIRKGDTEMHEHAVELTFTPETQAEILAAWNKLTVRDRLGAMAFTIFTCFLLLVCASMFLCMLSRRATRQESLQVVV